jgi:hypothetical protein
MKRQSKLTSRQSEQEQQLSHQESEQKVLEFPTVEEMLRHDARHTPVPPNIAHRLQESIGPVEARPWWRRLFGS